MGGPTSHAAILASALEIPSIAGIDAHILSMLSNGQQIAIDGTQGFLYLALEQDQQQHMQRSMLDQREQRSARRAQNLAHWRSLPGTTADGVAVQVFANVGDSESARAAPEFGASGHALLRTEFLFGGRPVF